MHNKEPVLPFNAKAHTRTIVIVVLSLTLLVLITVPLLTAYGEPTRRIWCCTEDGEEKEEFDLDLPVFFKGTGFNFGETYPIYIVNDVNWDAYEDQPFPARVTNDRTEVTANGLGAIEMVKIWNSANYGYYDIVVDFDRNGRFHRDIDVLDDDHVCGGGIFVVPEFEFGALLGLTACFAAFVLLKIRTKKLN